MGRVRHEVLHVQAAEVFGRLCQSHFEHVSQGLTACPGVHRAPPGTAAPGLKGTVLKGASGLGAAGRDGGVPAFCGIKAVRDGASTFFAHSSAKSKKSTFGGKGAFCLEIYVCRCKKNFPLTAAVCDAKIEVFLRKFNYTRVTLPDFNARVLTYTRLGLPSTRMRTF